ncbi:MAG: M20/M25/M40 family metallo-hydrolase [Myxococcales bacterium]|nr:M20/M25/M40 family metallo-hydrolase [Myxococcales bacterium]
MTPLRPHLLACLVLVGCSADGGGPVASSRSSAGAGGAAEDAGAPADAAVAEADAGLDAGARAPCRKLDAAIGRAALREHLERFEAIGKEHGGHRATRSPGYAASLAYVRTSLEGAGLAPFEHRFDILHFELLGPGTLEMLAPRRRVFRPVPDVARGAAWGAAEHVALRGSPPGDVRAELVAVDYVPGQKDTTSGCDDADFVAPGGASLVSGKIALLGRGKCTFAAKVRRAEAAGALAVVVANQGDAPDRMALMAGDLVSEPADRRIAIPAVFTTSAVGRELVAALERGPVELHVVADTEHRLEPEASLLVEVAGRRRDEVLMAGAHLDSVKEGPGVNDNGTGSAALLEIARALAGCTPERTVRLAWWGAEEPGLLGSDAYVAELGPDERRRVRAYVNLDMLGSVNHIFEIADGDGSKGKGRGPGTSAELERFFLDDFAEAKLPVVERPYHFRSDYRAFHRAGIGVGEVTTGADEKKGPAEVALFGGTNGRPDPCYHRPCDTVKNVDFDVYEAVARSVARAVERFGVEGGGLVVVEPPDAGAADGG